MPTLADGDRNFEISPDTWARLQAEAQPFESPNDVLRRLLGAKSAEISRTELDSTLPKSEYEIPLLQVLSDAGGSLPTSQAIEAVGGILKDRLTDADWATLKDGRNIVWRNRIQFARLDLVRAGQMKGDSPHGIWEITEVGEQRLREAGQ